MTNNRLNRSTSALVTGAAGFIGSHLIRFLAQQEQVRVIAYDDLSGGSADNIPADIEFIQGSVTDEALLRQLFDQYKFTHVYHLAAYAAEGLSHFIRRFNYTNNVIGSINLINEAVRNHTECFVFTSSIAVYGALPSPMREDQIAQPEDPYGIAKLTVELDLAAAQKMFGLKHVIFRPHNVYGEFQNLGDPYRNVVGIFMNQIMQQKAMTVFGDGSQQRAFSYVGDIVPMIAQSPRIPAAWNQVFNIGADKPYEVNELTRHVAAAMNVPDHPVEYLPAREEVQVAFSDHTKAEQVFGKRTQTPLSEGLARMADWARVTGIQSSRPFMGVEVERNMPPSWQKLLDQK
jgi:UDP-glucose 4-epimerase